MSAFITPDVLAQSISWSEYYAIAKGYAESDDRPALYQDEKMQRYTRENVARIDHILKTINIESKLYNALSAIKTDMIWLVLSEPWCGDASQVVPVLHTIASCTDRIRFRIIQSDAHPEVLDHYLTGTSRSIPKLICLRADTLEELGTWGPRPAALHRIVLENKDNPNISFGAKVRMVHAWYDEDKTASIQDEFIDLVKKWNDL